MIIKIGKYIFGWLALLLVTGCATTNFEWVKINPEKIQLAKERSPYSDEIRRVNMVLQLKAKDSVFYYPESSGFFAKDNTEAPFVPVQRTQRKNIKKSHYSAKHVNVQNTEPIAITKKKALIKSKSEQEESSANLSADKINAALKIPLNSKALKAGKNIASFGSSASEIREMAFNDIKKKNPELEQKSVEKQQRGKNLMWAGLILVILGGILGFVFGRSAFLISLAGVVFAGIGYFFKI